MLQFILLLSTLKLYVYTFTHLKSDFSATRCMEVLILKRSKVFYGTRVSGESEGNIM